MKRILALTCTFIFLATGSLAVIKVKNPDAFYSLAISFSAFEKNSEIGAEQQRLSKIRLLPISDEKKEILVSKTVFLGASPNMVLLALGKPMSEERDAAQEGAQRWIYHFQDDSRPTELRFEDYKLVSARKISSHTVQVEQHSARR